MGLFTTKQEVKPYQTKESKQAGKYLTGLMQQDVNIPTQQIANLNPLTQQAIQNYANTVPQLQQYYQQAGNTLMQMAQGQDPYNSPYYQNLRSEGERMANRAGTQARQSANMGGSLFSTPASTAEANARSTVDSALMSILGDLYMQNQQQQMAAAQGLQQLGQSQTAAYQQQAAMGSIQQQQQQAQYDAIYNQALQQAIAPFQYNAQIASAMYDPNFVMTGGGLTDFGFYMSTMASAGAAMAGGMAGGAA